MVPKVGVLIQETKRLLVPRSQGGERGGSIPSDSWIWVSVVSSPGGVRGEAPAENGFIVI